MALLFSDSVRHYTTAARMPQKWNSVTTGVAVNATAGRASGPAIEIDSSSTAFNRSCYKALPSAYGTLICGFRFKQATAFTATVLPFFAFRDGSNGQVAVAINSSGQLQAYKGDYTTTLGSASANALSVNTLYYIEVKALIDGSNGTLEVRVNGTSTGWLALTGVDTQATANATANQIIFGCSAPTSLYRYFCDIYCCDTSGSRNNDFLGEVNIDNHLPVGAGNYAQFTPSAGSNYACVDEADPNTTDYVSGATAGLIDTYAFADLAGNNPQIKAVVNNLWCMKTDSGTMYAKSKYRRGGADYTGPNLTPNVTYTDLQHIYETDPATGDNWTQANVNAAEFGVEVSTA